MDNEKRVAEIIHESMGTPIKHIASHKTLNDDLGMDSLDRIEFTMFIEEEYGIDIDDAHCDAWNTVQDVVDYVNTRI